MSDNETNDKAEAASAGPFCRARVHTPQKKPVAIPHFAGREWLTVRMKPAGLKSAILTLLNLGNGSVSAAQFFHRLARLRAMGAENTHHWVVLPVQPIPGNGCGIGIVV